MFKQLIKHYASASVEVLARATLEDMAILSALRDSFEENTEPKTRLDFVPNLIEAWLSVRAKASSEAETLRLQPLLGGIAHKLADSRGEGLNRSEFDLLNSARDLIERADASTHFAHISRLLALHSEAAAQAASRLPLQPGLTGFEGRIHIISSEDLMKARAQAVGTFSGLHLPSRGPVLKLEGDVRVLDQVPDNCTLVVDGGSCTVSGYVLGRIACSGGCEVRETVSGVIIGNRGDIRVRAILNRAIIVAKLGSVHTERTEDPELVFGGEKIIINGEARMGTYISPTIVIGDKVNSGNFSFSKSLSARRFTKSDMRDLVIQLREKVTNEDYGGVLADGADRLLGQLARLRRGIQNQRNLLAIAAHECEQYAGSAVIYLAGGDEHVDQITELNKAHRRLAFLDRVVAGIDLLSEAANDHLLRGMRDGGFKMPPEDKVDPNQGGRDLQDQIEHAGTEELDVHDTEDRLDEDLRNESASLRDISHKIRGLGMATSAVLLDLRVKKRDWLLERNKLVNSIREKKAAIQEVIAALEGLDIESENVAKVQLLSRLLTSAKRPEASQRLTTRTQAPFIQLILRSIEARRQHIATYKENLENLAEEYWDSSAQLVENFHIPAPLLENSSPSPPEVTGCFDEGITLCTESYMLDEPKSSLRSVVITENTGDIQITFRRMGNVIVELKAPVPVG